MKTLKKKKHIQELNAPKAPPINALHSITQNAPEYEVHKQSTTSRGAKLLQGLSSKRDLLILKEIFGKPMALRNPEEDHL